MQQKLVRQGEETQSTYAEFSEWCSDRSRELHSEIKIAKTEVSNLKAVIEEQTDEISSADTKIGELSASLSTLEADLKAVTSIRTKEHGDFVAQEQALTDTIDMLQRSSAILEREMKGGASLAQVKSAGKVVQALSAMVEATSLNTADTSALAALIQSATGSGAAEGEGSGDADGDEDLSEAADAAFGAPDPEAYKSQSGSIIETLQSLLEKSEEQLADARREEIKKSHSFELMKVELTQKLKISNAEMSRAKKIKAESAEKKATAEGEVAVATKGLKEDIVNLNELHHNCMNRASDFSEETKSRGEEMEALTKAKDVINEMTGAAVQKTYEASAAASAASFLQVKSRAKASSPPEFVAVHAVKKLAKEFRSTVLEQLGSKLDVAIRASSVSGEDPFTKVRGLISDMVARLEEEAGAEAQEKAYCDKELSETGEKKEDKEEEMETLSTKIDRLQAESTKLAEQLAILQRELAEIASTQAQMDSIRQKEKANFKTSKSEMEQGLKGIQAALALLREFYAKKSSHDSQEGAGSTILGMLEVVESDFSKGIAQLVSEEEAAVGEYTKTTNENALLKVSKEQDVKYKGKKSKQVAKAAAELTSDREGEQTELDAIMEYLGKLKEQCIAKPESYEERKKRREEEMAGLKEALAAMDGGAVFLQENSVRHHLRRARRYR